MFIQCEQMKNISCWIVNWLHLNTRNLKIWKMIKCQVFFLQNKCTRKKKMWFYWTTFIDFRWRRNRSSNLFFGSDWVRDAISRSWTGMETVSVLLCKWKRRWIRRRHLLVNLIGWLQKVHLKRISTLFLKNISNKFLHLKKKNWINLIFFTLNLVPSFSCIGCS